MLLRILLMKQYGQCYQANLLQVDFKNVFNNTLDN